MKEPLTIQLNFKIVCNVLNSKQPNKRGGGGGCALRRHLDSVAPETPIQDIVDRRRVWENQADLKEQGGWYPSPRRSLPVYTINNGGKQELYPGRPTILPRRPKNY